MRWSRSVRSGLSWVPVVAAVYLVLYLSGLAFGQSNSTIRYLFSMPSTPMYWLFLVSLTILALEAIRWLSVRSGNRPM